MLFEQAYCKLISDIELDCMIRQLRLVTRSTLGLGSLLRNIENAANSSIPSVVAWQLEEGWPVVPDNFPNPLETPLAVQTPTGPRSFAQAFVPFLRRSLQARSLNVFLRIRHW